MNFIKKLFSVDPLIIKPRSRGTDMVKTDLAKLKSELDSSIAADESRITANNETIMALKNRNAELETGIADSRAMADGITVAISAGK